ncbi:DUF6418 domain-containing protein [[Clostridium] innocuum]|nr:DUF6418 domain-containing protein [[Clostridium] innocuum]
MKIQYNVFKISLYFFSLIIAVSILNIFINMDFLALIIYVFFLIFIYKTKPKMFLKYLFMLVMFSYHIISVFMVENYKIYFYNLQMESHRTGAFLPLLTSYMILFIVLILLEANKNSHILKSQNAANMLNGKRLIKIGNLVIDDKTKIRLFSILIFAIVFYMIFRLRNSFFYNMGGINRFIYREKLFTSFDEKLYTYIPWLLPIPLISKNKKINKQAFVFFILYCTYMIWVGDKFGSLFMGFYIFILATWITNGIDKKKVKKLIVIAILILVFLMLFIAFQVLYERGSWSEVLVYFNNRLTGGQSDLWWRIYSTSKDSGFHFTEFLQDEVSAIFSRPVNIMEYNFGIYKMMRLAAPQEVIHNYLSLGIRFAASTQASLFYYFKYIGLYLGSIVLGILCFFLVNKMITSYKNAHVICSVCYTMLLYKWYLIMSMSDITMIGNSTTILALFVLAFLYMSKKRKHKIIKNDMEVINK